MEELGIAEGLQDAFYEAAEDYTVMSVKELNEAMRAAGLSTKERAAVKKLLDGGQSPVAEAMRPVSAAISPVGAARAPPEVGAHPLRSVPTQPCPGHKSLLRHPCPLSPSRS